MLIDSFGRKIDYLRISVTDRCNLRCLYCIPAQGIETFAAKEILTFEEITRLVKVFSSLGIKKVRLTGGEPLVRKAIINLIQSLVNIKSIQEVSLTTNGIILASYAPALKKVGLKNINISLDTLHKERFKEITRTDLLDNVLRGIKEVKKVGFNSLKLNMVVMKGINDDEVIDFMEFCHYNKLILRFIEFMNITPLWNKAYFIPIEAVKNICQTKFKLTKIQAIDIGSGPAQYYRTDKGAIVGFIKTDENNCSICRRLRLTSTGELKNCLYEKGGFRLREFLRNGFDDEKIKDVIMTQIKTKQSSSFYMVSETPQLYMCSIGG